MYCCSHYLGHKVNNISREQSWEDRCVRFCLSWKILYIHLLKSLLINWDNRLQSLLLLLQSLLLQESLSENQQAWKTHHLIHPRTNIKNQKSYHRINWDYSSGICLNTSEPSSLFWPTPNNLVSSTEEFSHMLKSQLWKREAKGKVKWSQSRKKIGWH